MKKYWEQLTSQERRWMAGIGIVLFVIFNYFLVFPRFGDYSRSLARKAVAAKKLTEFRAEIARQPQYLASINKLKAGAEDVPEESQAYQFVNTYQEKANQAGVLIANNGRSVLHTNNEFFVEQEVGIGVQSTEKQLVNFLYSLGAGNSLMRVKTLSLRPDQSHQQLSANLTIVASYQKKAAKAGGTPRPVAPPAKPAPAKPAAVKATNAAPAGRAGLTNRPPGAPMTPMTPMAPGPTNRGAALGARPASTNRPAGNLPKRP